jgi:hypothetical protein
MDSFYFIYNEDVYGNPMPLADSTTGCPSIFRDRSHAQDECDLLNCETDGGYFVGEGIFEDSESGLVSLIRAASPVT